MQAAAWALIAGALIAGALIAGALIAGALIAGALMILMAPTSSALRRLPLSTGMLYLLVGLAIGPGAIGLFDLDPVRDAKLLEHLSEAVVLVSLFTVGLKLALPLSDPRWRLPLRLALGPMVVTVALIAPLGWAIGLPIGAAVLLGAVLAPTDPVLASDVQVSDPEDRDRLRISLTGEGGLNDGTAFPFVMLGLGLLGLHELGEFGGRWVAVDVVWAAVAGLDDDVARAPTSITLVTIVCSIVLRGVSITPTMTWYEAWRARRRMGRGEPASADTVPAPSAGRPGVDGRAGR